jgi:hypothetical protein
VKFERGAVGKGFFQLESCCGGGRKEIKFPGLNDGTVGMEGEGKLILSDLGKLFVE